MTNTPTSILTISGRFVNLLDPTEDQISLDDICIAASRIPRFTGHSTITLAEHSCRVHDIVKREFRVTDPFVLRAALLHDAHEVYVGDASSPLKIAMRKVSIHVLGEYVMSDYDFVERTFVELLAAKYNYSYPLPAVVKDADMLALGIEADMTWGAGTAASWGLPEALAGYRFNDGDIASRFLAGSAKVITEKLPPPSQLERTDVAQMDFERKVG